MAAFEEFSKLTHELNKQINLRGMLRFKEGEAVPLEEASRAAQCLLPGTMSAAQPSGAGQAVR